MVVGMGLDAKIYHWDAWDPYYQPEVPEYKYDTIIVNHVANILTRESRKNLFKEVNDLLMETGKAFYFSPKEYTPYRETWSPQEIAEFCDSKFAIHIRG